MIRPSLEADDELGASAGEAWYVAITDFPRGLGSTARARSMCRALSGAGYRPRLLIPYALGHRDNDRAQGVSDGLRFEYVNGSPKRPSHALGVALTKVRSSATLFWRIARARSDLACVFVYNASLLDCWGVIVAARLFRIPSVLDLTDEWHDPAVSVRTLGVARYLFQHFARATERIVYHGVTRVITVSRHFERRLARYAEKTVRCPAAFDPTVFACAEPTRLVPPDVFSIVYAGSVSPIEGVDLLIQAFRALSAGALEKVTLSIVGSPAHNERIERYEELARDLVSNGRVRFLPAVDHGRYASVLRGADLLVIPRPTTVASSAGFPYKLIEYIASGTPVVVTRFGDVEEYFTSKVHCLICPPDDPASLATAMAFAMANPGDMREFARSGQRRVAELFSFDSVSRQLNALLAGAASSR